MDLHEPRSDPTSNGRPLTSEKEGLVRWLLEHSNQALDASGYLFELDRARVVSHCPCGCASIEFSIGGVVADAARGVTVLSDYEWTDDSGARFGVFVFAKGGQLSGLEVWSMDGLTTPTKLPEVGMLRPLEIGGGD